LKVLFVYGLFAGLSVYGQQACHDVVTQGLRFQIQADSIQHLIEEQVIALEKASESQRNIIKMAIRDYEIQASAFQKEANDRFAQAVALETNASVHSAAGHEAAAAENSVDVEIANEARYSKSIEQKNVPKSEFAILPKSPYSAANPIPLDETLPDGVVYKIQLGAFSKPLSTSVFKGLTPVSGEKLPNGITKYYAGFFLRFADADDALRKVREYGFKDAYVVAFYNRKTINPERAKQLEK
jgi:hypothetical protein